MSTPEKCPKCGAGSFDKWTTGHQFECNTLVLSNGLTFDGLICMKAQRDQLAERVKRLEAAGDKMASWLEIPTVLGGNSDAVDAWNAAKGQP